MSKELEKLEKMAEMNRITDLQHIDKIIKYIFSLPFSYFRKDAARYYKYLRDDLCRGFNIRIDEINRITFEDVLFLIGYEPGNSYFDPSQEEFERYERKYNAATDLYALACLIDNLSKTDIRIREFTHIDLSAYVDYLIRNSDEDKTLCRDVGEFKVISFQYLLEPPKPTIRYRFCATIGDLINKTTTICGRSWQFPLKSIDKYSSEIIDSYDMLNRLFMDAVRMPLIHSGRDRLIKIINEYGNKDWERSYPLRIDYELCYEN